MLAAERRGIILQKVHDEGKVIVGELSKEFDVSEETIRRDLEKLEEDGHVTKTYGGAVLNDRSSIDLPFNVRWKANPGGKQKIAEMVNEQIADGDNIFLDASTTAVMIAKNIKDKRRLTVITNSIENMLALSDAPGYTILSTGGMLKPDSMSLVGKKAQDSVATYNVDKAFISAKGVDISRGITDGNDETASIKQVMIESAARIYLVVDSSKFDRVAFAQICSFDRVDAVITDEKPDNRWIAFFEENRIELIYPGTRGSNEEKYL